MPGLELQLPTLVLATEPGPLQKQCVLFFSDPSPVPASLFESKPLSKTEFHSLSAPALLTLSC